MQKTPSQLFDVAARYQRVGEPHNVVAQLRKGHAVTPQESTRFLNWLVNETRAIVDASARAEFNEAAAKGAPIPARDMRNDPLHGRCSFMQTIASYALLDRGIDPKPFSVQSLPGYTVGHATMSLPIAERDGDATYIVDPSYRQFCDPKTPTFEGKPMPGFVLKDMDGGPAIIDTLMRDGYIKATPEIAQKYLASFTGGVSTFGSPAAAMKFLKNPPYDNGRASFARPAMEKGGWLIGAKA